MIKRVIIAYAITFFFVIILSVIAQDKLATLTFVVAGIFAPLRLIFPGFSARKEESGTNLNKKKDAARDDLS
jgi:archaellum biogenesis protein FlaJ (TadC family)